MKRNELDIFNNTMKDLKKAGYTYFGRLLDYDTFSQQIKEENGLQFYTKGGGRILYVNKDLTYEVRRTNEQSSLLWENELSDSLKSVIKGIFKLIVKEFDLDKLSVSERFVIDINIELDNLKELYNYKIDNLKKEIIKRANLYNEANK